MKKALLILLILCAPVLAAEPDRSTGPKVYSFGPSTVGGKSYQGEEITCDLPLSEMFWNIGSYVDGSGMCVDSSLEQGGTYAGVPGIKGFRNWAAKYPGGSYPQKVDQQIPAYFKSKGLPVPEYLQYTGDDPQELRALLETIDRTGRVACIAYGFDPRYGSAINHMVFSPKPGSGKYACIVDNNAIGGVKGEEGSRFVWMLREEFETRMRTCADRFGRPMKTNPWVFVWLAPPPPPIPFN